MPGEQSWPTQPFPTVPPPFARLKFGPDDINPYLDEEERVKLREIMLASRNEGLFTPQTLNRNQISSPGELGGANWGGSAGHPTTGMLYVRSADQPGFHTLREPGARGSGGGGQNGTPAQRGRAAFTQLCQDCHGQAEANGIHSMDRTTIIPVKQLGAELIRRTVRGGMGQMPPFETDALTDENLNALITYLSNPAAGRGGGGGGGRNTTPLPPIEGVTRYTGPLGSCSALPMAWSRSVLRGRRLRRMT